MFDTTPDLNTLLDSLPISVLQAALARHGRVTPVLDRLGSRGGTFRGELLMALAEHPMSNDELRARFPDVRVTMLHATLHELKQRGFICQDPARYRLVPDAQPVSARLAPRTGRYRTQREPLKLEELPEHLRDQLGQMSDLAIAEEAGLKRSDVRELRISMGIEAVSRGGRPKSPSRA